MQDGWYKTTEVAEEIYDIVAGQENIDYEGNVDMLTFSPLEQRSWKQQLINVH